jgi:preprotein translocase subunit SecB
MQVTPAPLKCHGYFLTGLMLIANPEYDKKKPTLLKFEDLKVDSSADALPEEQGKKLWRVALQIQQNVGAEKNAPYNFSAALVGTFEVHPKFPADKVKQLAAVNGGSILYSTARQILREAMHNGPFPALDLPTVRFIEPEQPAPATQIAEVQPGYGEKPAT